MWSQATRWCTRAITIMRYTTDQVVYDLTHLNTLALLHDMCTSYQNMLEIRVVDCSQISVSLRTDFCTSNTSRGKNNVQRLC